jgi:hypothetical protein
VIDEFRLSTEPTHNRHPQLAVGIVHSVHQQSLDCQALATKPE